MDDLERLFHQLVQVLSATDPERLRSPFSVSELHQTILPYRRYRTDLGFEAIEDYEMAILRLLAGEGGFATVEPGETLTALREEAAAINPTPGAFRQFPAATITLNRRAVHSVLNAERAYAPPRTEVPDAQKPESKPEPEPVEAPGAPGIAPFEPSHAVQAAAPPPVAGAGPGRLDDHLPSPSPTMPSWPTCAGCAAGLPPGRLVTYCPYCGTRVSWRRCDRCGEPLESGWRHCITCGEPASDSPV